MDGVGQEVEASIRGRAVLIGGVTIITRLPIMRSRIMDTIILRIPIRRRIRPIRITASRLGTRLRRTGVIDCGKMFLGSRTGLREGFAKGAGTE